MIWLCSLCIGALQLILEVLCINSRVLFSNLNTIQVKLVVVVKITNNVSEFRTYFDRCTLFPIGYRKRHFCCHRKRCYKHQMISPISLVFVSALGDDQQSTNLNSLPFFHVSNVPTFSTSLENRETFAYWWFPLPLLGDSKD